MSETQKGCGGKALLVVFWLYVLIPLLWGVSHTLSSAMKLFE